MEQVSSELTVILFRGDVGKRSPSNSLAVPQNPRKWETTEELLSEPIFIDGDDLVFRSTDGSVEILRLDLKYLLEDSYMRAKVKAIGMSTDYRLALAQCIKEKGRELGIKLISKDDWDDIFNVLVRPYRSEKATQHSLDN
ncbi:hypothetical protein ND446_16030 [Yersinia ruckeri]|uniref:hypothetical protein n=1 Tax=Yersinia ruckeri TaxID=29486 RepID=UPI002264E0EB|nr:hypothetical protein [Yersinia ruckeri]UZX55250.1 hypothetical protein ND446_16030 [Yersinia ruckeri]